MFKHIFITIASLITLLSLSVEAANKTTASVNKPQSRVAGQVYQGRSLSGYYSTASTFKFDGAYEGSFNSTSSLGVGLNFSEINMKDFGYHLSFNFEAPREITSVTVSGTRLSLKDADPKIGFFTIEPSLSYGLTSKAYAFAGFNYNIPTSKRIASFEVSSDWGVQVGGGYLINDKLSIEALYRQVNFKARSPEDGQIGASTKLGALKNGANASPSSQTVDLGGTQMEGLIVKLTYLVD